MTPALLAVVMFCAPIDSPFTILVREKYGPTLEITDATCVLTKDNAYYVLRRGNLAGTIRWVTIPLNGRTNHG